MLLHVLCSVFLAMHYRILSQDFSPLQISLIYNFAAMIILSPLIIRRRSQLIKSNILWPCILEALCLFLAQVAIIIAYDNMPFFQVAAIELTYPLLSTTAAVIFLKEKVGIHNILAIIVGFIGAGVIISPSMDASTSINNFNYYFLSAIFAVLLWVVSDMITNKITCKDSVSNQLLISLFFVGLFSILLSGLLLIVTENDFPEIENYYWILFCLIGIVVVFYELCDILAIGRAEVNVVTPFYFTVFPVSYLVAYFVFSEMVEISTFIGATMIVVSMIYISFREYKATQLKL